MVCRFTVADGVYEKDKKRLANMMAFGKDVEPSAETSKRVVPRKPEVESDEEIDRFQERKYRLCPALHKDVSSIFHWGRPRGSNIFIFSGIL